MEPRCPRGLRTGTGDGALEGEKGQTPICVSVVWKSRSQQLRRRGDEASWVWALLAPCNPRLLKSRRASRYLVPPTLQRRGMKDTRGEAEEGGGWVSPSGCVQGGPEMLVATGGSFLLRCVACFPMRSPHGGRDGKRSQEKKRTVMVRGEERSRREATPAR